MGRAHTRKFGLLWRISLFLTAFFLMLALQWAIGNFQTRFVTEPENKRTANIQMISSFLNNHETSMKTYDDYRWEYGDVNEFVSKVRSQRLLSASYLCSIADKLSEVGREQYLLSGALKTSFASFSSLNERLCDDLLRGNGEAASDLYFSKIKPCAAYIRVYAQELLQRAIVDNQEQYAGLMDLNGKLMKLRKIVLTICLALGTAMLVFLARLLRFFSVLSRQSNMISRGMFDMPDIEEERGDEIGAMAGAFNAMKHSMKRQVRLLEEKREAENALFKQKNEALGLQNLLEHEKLRQLRSQINPHFLFNTLNVIKISAEEEGAEKTASMLSSLGLLYRYAIASNSDSVPLSREIQIVRALSSLYKARFGDKITVVWQASPSLDVTLVMVPSFILQPLVENAFKHGFGPKEGRGTVKILIRDEGRMLSISVSDDGVGMDGETLEKVRENLSDLHWRSDHIGLYNIAARLRLRSREGVFEIFSKQGKGTTVRFTLPLVLQDEEKSDD